MESRQTTARVLAAVGGVAVLAGGVLLYLDLSRASGEEAAGKTVVGAGCAPSGCALTVAGSM